MVRNIYPSVTINSKGATKLNCIATVQKKAPAITRGGLFIKQLNP